MQWKSCWTVKLYTDSKHDSHCTGGWVDPRTGLHRCGKFHSPPPPGHDRMKTLRRWNLTSFFSAFNNTVSTNYLHVFRFLLGKFQCCSSYNELNTAAFRQTAVTVNAMTGLLRCELPSSRYATNLSRLAITLLKYIHHNKEDIYHSPTTEKKRNYQREGR
jgi:hypothetical protein